MRELILYATPTGALADRCERYFERLLSDGLATTAQTYPPHCTLTGFFHRSEDRAAEVTAEFREGLAAAGPVPSGAVEVVGLVTNDDWVGLEMRSAWLRELTENLAAAQVQHAEEDPLRIKDWLHLSLAYGTARLGSQAMLAREMIDPTAGLADTDMAWEVGLWERLADGGWVQLTQ
ncbi:MAG: hypothetical protein ACRBK7_25040 [Acidimicrobiales bacterium]